MLKEVIHQNQRRSPLDYYVVVQVNTETEYSLLYVLNAADVKIIYDAICTYLHIRTQNRKYFDTRTVKVKTECETLPGTTVSLSPNRQSSHLIFSFYGREPFGDLHLLLTTSAEILGKYILSYRVRASSSLFSSPSTILDLFSGGYAQMDNSYKKALRSYSKPTVVQ